MTKKQKKMLYRILAAAVLFLAAKLIPLPMLVSAALYFAAYLTVGCDILRKAWKGICNRQVFDENFLMAVATVGAIALALYERSGDYSEAVAVMLFYQIGELFQSYAVGKSRRSITALMDIRPDYANIERDGKLEQVDPDDVAVGTTIVVQPGEKVPIDGVVEDGVSGILAGDSDESLLAALIRAFGEEGKRIAKTAAQYAAPFSTEGFADKVEACYLKAIEAHKRG